MFSFEIPGMSGERLESGPVWDTLVEGPIEWRRHNGCRLKLDEKEETAEKEENEVKRREERRGRGEIEMEKMGEYLYVSVLIVIMYFIINNNNYCFCRL